MNIFLALIGGLQLGIAVLMFFTSKSAMHETTAAVIFGFGCVCCGLANIGNMMKVEARRREEAEAARQKAEYEARENARAKAYP